MNNPVVEQSALLNLSSKEYDINYVDENQPLKVYTHPTHWKAHKLQIALERLEKQMRSNPAQFNAPVYFSTIDKLAELMEEINASEVKKDVHTESGAMVENGDAGAAPEMGVGASAGLHMGISADNPFAGPRPRPA